MTNGAEIAIRLGDSSGFDSAMADYDWHVSSVNASPENISINVIAHCFRKFSEIII